MHVKLVGYISDLPLQIIVQSYPLAWLFIRPVGNKFLLEAISNSPGKLEIEVSMATHPEMCQYGYIPLFHKCVNRFLPNKLRFIYFKELPFRL